MLTLVYSNFLREVRLSGWGTEDLKALTLGHYVRVRALPFHSVMKWKYIMMFEIRYFYLEIGLSPKGLTQSQESYSRKLPNYRQ